VDAVFEQVIVVYCEDAWRNIIWHLRVIMPMFGIVLGAIDFFQGV
jgi:hypothetical protein